MITETVTEKELIEKYQEFAGKMRANWKINPELMVVNTRAIEEFCKGIGECELGYNWDRDVMFDHNSIRWRLWRNKNEWVERWGGKNGICFSYDSITITSYDKTATLWNPMFIYKNLEEKKQHGSNDSVMPHFFHMIEATEDGCYFLYLSQSEPDQNYFKFYSNADIIDCGYITNRAEQVEGVKFYLAHGCNIYYEAIGQGLKERFGELRNGKHPLPSISCDLKDFNILANKIYRKGLPYVANLAKRGWNLEITDDDRKLFEETYEVSQENDLINKKETSAKDRTDISNLEEAIIALKDLNSMGVELTDSQRELVTAYDRLIGKLNSQKFMWYYEKLNSNEFQQYKDSAQDREERLQTVREDIASKEEAKKEWYESPENPSNMRETQIQTLSNQLNTLNKVSEFMPLADFQEESRKELETFFDMKEQADEEDHTLDSAMSESVRTWYQDEYGKQETCGKTK